MQEGDNSLCAQTKSRQLDVRRENTQDRSPGQTYKELALNEGGGLMAKIALNVDGKSHTIEADSDMPLLYALRDDLGLRNPKFGCGLAQCGACTVIIDGLAVRSCVTPVDSVQNTKITTLAGLGGGKAHKLQEAFILEQVPQCGYCLNGWVMTAAAFLEKTPKPTEDQMKEALTGIKCRCGTHMAILRAVMRVAQA
jgi:nicotinate dehydrogenase subunit A